MSMRTLLFGLLVLHLLLALEPRPPEGDTCTAVLPTGTDRGIYQLWLCTDTGEQLIHNNLVPGPDGVLTVTQLPAPGPGEQYRFRMIGAGEGQIFDPGSKEAEIRWF